MKETAIYRSGRTARGHGGASARPTRNCALAVIRKRAPYARRVVFEKGPLSVWFYHALTAEGLPVICIDARHAKAPSTWPRTRPMAWHPEEMANLARDLFGDEAATAAAWCAVQARSGGREADYRFWFRVFLLLGGVSEDDRRRFLAGEP